jgi:hypothetical protein
VLLGGLVAGDWGGGVAYGHEHMIAWLCGIGFIHDIIQNMIFNVSY